MRAMTFPGPTHPPLLEPILTLLLALLCVLVVASFLLRSRKSESERLQQQRSAEADARPQDVERLTGVVGDTCIDHFPATLDYLEPRLRQRCSSTKFNGTSKHVMMHNRGEICLAGCFMHYGERQNALFELLKETKRVMDERLQIPWCLFYGGLLGLERDGALIPWDVDLDIVASRDLVEKLARSVAPGQLVYEDDAVVVRHKPDPDQTRFVPLTVESRASGLFADVFVYEDDPGDPDFVRITMNVEPGLRVRKSLFQPFEKRPVQNPRTGEVLEAPVPHNAQAMLMARYGGGFMKPEYILQDEKYVFVGS